MRRDLSLLDAHTYDVLIVGGGIYGATLAWDAALRGLSVALVEKGDFGQATSANSLKIVHGGIRYLQQADLKRMRESIRERRTLLKVAPHLVHPLGCLMPTYGHFDKGREVMALALALNDLVGYDRNRLVDPARHLPGGRMLSRGETLSLLPGIPSGGLTGGALWYDGQMYNAERLTLSFVLSAAKAGAVVANYVEATGYLRKDGRVTGVAARDVLSGGTLAVRARAVVNTSGPWLERTLQGLGARPAGANLRLAKAVNLIARRPRLGEHAVALRGPTNVLFFTPWRGYALIGTTYTPYDGDLDDLSVGEEEIRGFLGEVNAAWPGADVRREDVVFAHVGLVPIEGADPSSGRVRRAGHYHIVDHRRHGIAGLFSVLGVKYTTARDVAEKVVDLIFAGWGKRPPPSRSSTTPLHGGEIERLETFLATAVAGRPAGLDEQTVRRLVYNYGTAYAEVLGRLGRADGGLSLDEERVRTAQVLHAVREEMAQKLVDVVFRRTELGTAGSPEAGALLACANAMAGELGWSHQRVQQELAEVQEHLARRGSAPKGVEA